MIATRVNKNSNFLPLYLAISTLVSWVLGATVIIGWLNPPFYWSTSHLSAKLLVVQSQVSIVKSLYNFSLSNSDAPWSNPIFHGEITTPDGEIAISLMAKSMLPMIIPYVSHFSSHIIATFPGFPYPFFSTCQMRFVRFYVSWSSAFSSPALSWAPPVQRRHESSVAYQKKKNKISYLSRQKKSAVRLGASFLASAPCLGKPRRSQRRKLLRFAFSLKRAHSRDMNE